MDKYDRAIAYLTEHPEEIFGAWSCWDNHRAGCLFNIIPGSNVCLTEARLDPEEISANHPFIRITEDERIPESPDEITVDDLPVLAEWQRKLDKAYPDRE